MTAPIEKYIITIIGGILCGFAFKDGFFFIIGLMGMVLLMVGASHD